MRRTAVLSACVLAGALLIPSSAALATDDGHDKGQDRWIAVEDHFAVVLPNGDTFTDGNQPPMGGPQNVPPVGTRLYISESVYTTTDGKTQGDKVGRTHIECDAQVVENTFLCDIAFVLDKGSQLLGSVAVDFSNATAGQQFDIAVTGGTGDFAEATGVVSFTDMSDPNKPTAPSVTLYEPHLG
jgi:hypothetical protein